jgi:acyl-CoA reductase-like NAD-dependent aldehyde dehydrogenase
MSQWKMCYGLFYRTHHHYRIEHLCRTNQEEIFGPVVTIMPFDTEEEVLDYANSTTYGLAATIWTENLKRAHRVAAQVKSGIIWVNCWLFRDLRTPFGGMKQSGVGREGGFEALKFFTGREERVHQALVFYSYAFVIIKNLDEIFFLVNF